MLDVLHPHMPITAAAVGFLRQSIRHALISTIYSYYLVAVKSSQLKDRPIGYVLILPSPQTTPLW